MVTVLAARGSLRERASRPGAVVYRNVLAYRRSWWIFVSGFFEPFFYLLSIGIGLGHLVGRLPGPDGRLVPYAAFVAPAMLASSAMNGAVIDGSYNVFFRLKYAKLYDSMLATPIGTRDVAVGEITWALMRGSAYALVFLGAMALLGLVASPWALLAVPAAVLIGFAFAAVAMASATYLRGWQDFDYLNVAIMLLFLFSATFYPLSTYPPALRIVVECTPLYQACALVRECTLGGLGLSSLGHVAYLFALALFGLWLAGRRLDRLLLR